MMMVYKKPEVSTYGGGGTATTVVTPELEKNGTTYAENGVNTGGGIVGAYMDWFNNLQQNATSMMQQLYEDGKLKLDGDTSNAGSEVDTGNAGSEVDTGNAGSEDDTSDWDTKLTYVYDAVSGKWVPKTERKVDTYEQFLMGEDAYEQFLTGAEGYAKGVRDTTYAANAAARASAEKNAEKERQRAIVDADASYQLNTSAYGANAERLASMGLTNSGYADYMKSQSYAQMRGEVQNANAQSDYAKRAAAEQETSANREADLKYADYVNTAEGKLAEYQQDKADKLAEYQQGKTDQLTAVADTLLAAASSVTSAEELEALISRANNAGLSQDVINNIKSVGDSAVVKYGEETTKTAYYDILDAIDKGASLGEVEIMMKDAGITESSEYYISLTDKVRDRDMQERSDGYASDIEANGVFADIHSILGDKNNGLIGQEEYNKLVKDWNAIAETELEAILADLNAGAVYDQRQLKSLLEHISSAPMTPNVSSLYFKVNKYYQEKYGSASGEETASEAGDEPSYMSYIPKTNDGVKAINIDSAELANEGDWFTIKVEDNSKWVKSGGLAEEEDVNKAAKDLSDNTVFLYDGEIYIKYGNKVYSVKARDSYGGDYDDVYDTLKTGNYNLSTVETIKGIGEIGKSIKSNIVKNIWNKLTGK